MSRDIHIAASKFKREGNDTLTICFKEDGGEVIVNRVNNYDSHHRDYFLERKTDKKLSHAVVHSLRGFYKVCLRPVLYDFTRIKFSLAETFIIKFSGI